MTTQKPSGETLQTILETQGLKAVIDAVCGLNGWYEDIWCAAMTAHYGSPGIHSTRLSADGTPSAECLAEFPDIAGKMADARSRLDYLFTKVGK